MSERTHNALPFSGAGINGLRRAYFFLLKRSVSGQGPTLTENPKINDG